MKIKHLALVISAVLSTSLSAHAAQEDNTNKASEESAEAIEVIEVTGIRSSLKEAQAIKKLADNIIDVLVAEDIGKFPDENVAEALQRISGISVTRKNGEGQTVTIRGLSGNYNITSFNGRKLASDNATRDFNYDVIASELVGEIQVHKSQQAHLQEGAIGGVINIDTRKPLDLGRAASISIEADYNERAESTNPKASLIVSETFNDDTFGALFSLVHTKTTSRYDSYRSGWWNDFTYDEVAVDAPAGSTGDDIFRTPQFPKINMNRSERERTGGTLALQWRPTDELDINFDTLYTQYDIDASGKTLSLVMPNIWGPNGDYTELNIGEDGLIDSAAFTPATLELLEDSQPRESKTFQVGLNVNYSLDQFNFNIDLSHSEAENKNNGDTKFVVVRAAVEAASINFNNGNSIPDIELSQPLDETADYGAHYSRIDGDNITDKTTRFVFDGIYEPYDGIITNILFGVGYNMQEKAKVHYTPKNGSIFAQDWFDTINPTYDAETVVIGGQTMWKLPNDVIIPGNGDNFGGGSNVPTSWASIDVDALYDFYQTLDPDAYQQVIPSLSNASGDTFTVKEETTHAYIEAVIEDELFGKPYLLDFGIRYVKTDVTSSGFSQNPANLIYGADGLPANDDWQIRELVNFDGSYSKVLPSMNFKISLTDDVVFRFAASEALSRPDLWRLSPNTSISPITESGGDNKSKGTMYENDPGLAPYTADQFDTAIEWYYSETGNVAFAMFFKELNSFIKNDITSEVIAGQDFKVTRPYNDSDNNALIRGYELAWFQTFDEYLPESLAGFGIAANYTFNNSVSGEHDTDGNEIPFWGLSKHQTNANIFYEKNNFSINVALNVRSKFNNRKAWRWTYETNGWLNDEQAESSQWKDLSISMSYDITENLKITADANNLLDPDDNVSVNAAHTSSSYTYSSAGYGRRYSAGIRYKF
jgi:TonB-dependent receptor